MTAGLPVNAEGGSRFRAFYKIFSGSKPYWRAPPEPLAQQGVRLGAHDVTGAMASGSTPGQIRRDPETRNAGKGLRLSPGGGWA